MSHPPAVPVPSTSQPTLRQRVYWAPLDLRIAYRARGLDSAVFYGESIGDNLLCTVVLRELRQRTPPARLGMVTYHPELFARNPHVHALLPPAAALSGSLQRLGKPLLRPDYNRATGDPDRDHSPTRHLAVELCASVGIHGKIRLEPEFYLSLAERAAGRRAARQVAIVSGGSGARFRMRNKEWPANRFQAVVDALRGTATILHLGTTADPALTGVRDLRGRTTLREAAAILANADCFVGIPGFMMHLARAVDCPSVIVYGGRERPQQSGYSCNQNLATSPSCSPCWRRNGCDFERICLTAITPAAVIHAVQVARATARPLPVETALV